jgi:hypothetical protein
MAAYTTTHLLSSISRRSFAPTNQLTFQTSEILEIADEEIKTTILPNIMAVREEYFVFYKDLPLVANQAAYNIPARALGGVIREVQLIDSNNAVTDLPRTEPERVTSLATGSVDSFYVRGNQIVLNRPPSSAGKTLRLYFFLTPGALVQTSAAGVISAIDTNANTVTITSIPNTWVTGDSFDFIKKDGGHEYIDIDFTSTDITSNVITFSSLPSTLAVGDYVSLAGESPLVQLPDIYRPVLAQQVAAVMLESMTQAGADKAKETAVTLMKNAQMTISPRIQGETRVVTPKTWF